MKKLFALVKTTITGKRQHPHEPYWSIINSSLEMRGTKPDDYEKVTDVPGYPIPKYTFRLCQSLSEQMQQDGNHDASLRRVINLNYMCARRQYRETLAETCFKLSRSA